MKAKLYAFLEAGDEHEAGYLTTYDSLEQLLEDKPDADGTIFIYQLVDEGHVEAHPKFVSHKKK